MNPRERTERTDPWSLYRTLIEGVPDGPTAWARTGPT